MAFDVGSVIAHIKADTTDFQRGMQEAHTGVKSLGTRIDSFGGTLKNLGQRLTLVSAVVGGGLTLFLRDASQEAINFERAMTTLDIIAGRFGVSGDEAKSAAEDLGRELRIGIGPAAESLQNLLKSGLNLGQARDLLKRFTNEAITGKSPTLTLSQAVQNLSFAYATNNSALGNLSGISENFEDITERGRAALEAEGMAAGSVTDEMAKLRGMMDLTNLTMGSSERFTGTLIDKQAQLDQKVSELKKSFGELINPFLSELVTMLTSVVSWVNSLSEEQKKGILVITAVIAIIGPLLIILGTLVSGISAVISIATALGTVLTFLAASPIILLIAAVAALYFAWKYNFMGIQDQVKALWELINIKFNEGVAFLREVGGRIRDAIVKPFDDAWSKVQETVNKIKDKLDFTKRNSPSVVDIVNRSVYLVNRALEDLSIQPSFSTPQIAAQAAGAGGMMASVNISLDGAVISDEFGASAMGEILGDAIIQRLKQNVRF